MDDQIHSFLDVSAGFGAAPRSARLALASATAMLAFLLVPQARGQDLELAAQKLAKAKGDYERAITEIQRDLDKALTEMQRKLKEGQSFEKALENFDRLDTERKELETRGAWPPSIKLGDLTQRRDSARNTLIVACQEAGLAAIPTSDRREMDAMKAELAAFRAVTDLAPWKSILPLARGGWLEEAGTLRSPSNDGATADPRPLSIVPDESMPIDQYAIEFVVRMDGAAGGFRVRGLDTKGRAFAHRVSKADFDAGFATRVFGRDGVRFLLLVQQGATQDESYVRLDMEAACPVDTRE